MFKTVTRIKTEVLTRNKTLNGYPKLWSRFIWRKKIVLAIKKSNHHNSSSISFLPRIEFMKNSSFMSGKWMLRYEWGKWTVALFRVTGNVNPLKNYGYKLEY